MRMKDHQNIVLPGAQADKDEDEQRDFKDSSKYSKDKETPEYVLPGAEEDKDEYEDSSDSKMNWEYYTGLRVVTMFNHKAIEASNEENKKYILVPGPQAVELIGTEA